MAENLKLNEEDQSILDDYKAAKEREAEVKEELAELQPYVLEIMEEFGLKNLEQGNLNVTYVPESTSYSFDSTKFKKDNPAIAEQYQKESVRKPHIRAKLKE